VVWLHGLGADGHDFEPIVPQLELPAGTEWRFVFPHAPVRPVTLNGGMRMRAWFDIYSLDRDGPVDEAGIRESAARLGALVEQQVGRGVPADRVVVAGLSQGGAVAAHFALRYAEPLAGLMVLSAYLPLLSTLQREVADTPQSQTRDLPVFMAHGTFDPVLPCQLGKIARDAMQSLGYKVQWFEYPMPHAVCPAEVTDIGHWLARCLPGSDQTS
jgi:phospholipase/carboxylesterase